MRASLFAVGLVSAGVLTAMAAASQRALAQNDPVADRQETMAAFSEAHKRVSAMVKGHSPYDATAAAGAVNSIAAGAAQLAGQFPPDSQAGDDTRASAKIWQNIEDFDAHISRLQAAANAAASAAPQGLAAFAPAYEAMAGTCKACHVAYRLPTANAAPDSLEVSRP